MRSGASSALATQMAKQMTSRNPTAPLGWRKKDRKAMKPLKKDEGTGSCLPGAASAENEGPPPV
jgi:hypothetical protein